MLEQVSTVLGPVSDLDRRTGTAGLPVADPVVGDEAHSMLKIRIEEGAKKSHKAAARMSITGWPPPAVRYARRTPSLTITSAMHPYRQSPFELTHLRTHPEPRCTPRQPCESSGSATRATAGSELNRTEFRSSEVGSRHRPRVGLNDPLDGDTKKQWSSWAPAAGANVWSVTAGEPIPMRLRRVTGP